MLKLDVLADTLAGLRPVRAQQRRCLPAVSPQSPCSACQSICPEGAIALTPGPIMAECSGCGLCTAVCPSDALTLDSQSDHELLQQISTVTRRSRAVSVGCRPDASVQVGCPGRMPAELLLAAVATGAERVEVVCPDSSCLTCRYAAGQSLAAQAVRTATDILTALGRSETVTLVDRPTPPTQVRANRAVHEPLHQDRRDFLLAAFGLLRQSVPTVIPGSRPATPDQPDATARSPRRDLLLWACECLKPPEHSSVRWPGSRPHLATFCSQCGVCQQLCPGRVLSLGDTGLALLPRRCMGCGLCVKVCPAGALAMEPGGELADLLQTAPVPLGRSETLTCHHCGEAFAATVPTDPTAPTCLTCHIRNSRGEDWLT